jgi:hypothetical protein
LKPNSSNVTFFSSASSFDGSLGVDSSFMIFIWLN